MARLAEKAAVGFEPTMGKPNGFAIRPISPLWHTADAPILATQPSAANGTLTPIS